MSAFVDKAMMVGGQIGSQKHLASVKDGFISLMPLIMAGSAALIVKNIPIPGWQSILPGGIVNVCNFVWWGTFGFLSVYAVFAIAYNLAKYYGMDQIRTGFVALASFLAVIPQSSQINGSGAWGWISWGYTNSNSMFIAIAIALVSTEIFVRLSKNKYLVIKMPDTVPPAVSKSFSAMIPAILTISIIATIGVLVEFIFSKNVFDAVSSIFIPLVKASDSLASGLVIVFLTHLFWIIGLHGPSIVGAVWEPLSLKLLSENQEALALGLPIPHIMSNAFLNSFVYLGGAGATLGLLIATLLVARSKMYRTLGKACIGPGIFEINEPVIFGLPIVLNPFFIIPFVFGPIVLTIISYIVTNMGLVGRAYAIIPWATPPIASGYLATGDWRACVLQVVNIAISIIIYMPFVKIADRMEMKRESA
jgi:PTS system cellobiose-specific IIC component